MDYTRILYSEISFKPAKLTQQQQQQQPIHHQSHHNSNNNHNSEQAAPATPKYQLCDPNLVKLDWLQAEKIGGGLVNVGNTCFLNSVLQCLTYCPPLYNFLVKLNGGHSSSCKINQFCMLCEMEKHVKRIKNSNGSSIKPISIVQRLKYINKSFQFGRQEDAHEFLRYIIDHMWKACLLNLDISSKNTKLDPKIKETTVINHIFGGYHRSQVLCLTCNTRSNTFDFFMDFILDIRNAKSLEEALKKFTQPETLENENAYKCSRCKKKVTARKKFTVYKAPNVATFQLKRFDSDRIFGGKVTKFISYPDELDLRPYMSDTTKSSIKYQLSAVLVHVGHSSNSGHYFCFIKNSNNFWYRMDDSNVSLVNQNTVLQQQAYVLFYTRKASDQKYPSNGIAQDSSNSIKLKHTANNNTTISNSNNKTSMPISASSSHQAQLNSSQTNGKQLSKQTNGNTKITSYFTTQQQQQPQQQQPSTSQPQNLDSKEPITNGTVTTAPSSENGLSKTHSVGSSFTTWYGSKSNLDEEDSNKRKFNEITDRDKFNEELDQGKTKMIKSRNRDDRFSNLSKTNPFQRFTSNGYQQYNNNRNNHNYNNRNNNNNNNNRNNRNTRIPLFSQRKQRTSRCFR